MITFAQAWQAAGWLAFSLGDNLHAFEYSSGPPARHASWATTVCWPWR